jgi:elongation factor P
MATTADFRNGLCLEFNNDIFQIIEFQHVKPGKGPAFVRTKMRSVRTGKVIDNTFSAGHKITTARVEKRGHQYLYQDDYGFNFMDSESFEQISVPVHLVENADLMKEGQLVDVLFHAEREEILGVELPQFVVLTVTYTEPGLRGDTATNTLKPATMETGAIVQVPLFVNQDDLLRIDTRTRGYVERAKA